MKEALTGFGIGAFTQSVLAAKLFQKHILNHSNGSLGMDRNQFNKIGAKGLNSYIDLAPISILRGGSLGFITLTLYDRILNFLEENRENMT